MNDSAKSFSQSLRSNLKTAYYSVKIGINSWMTAIIRLCNHTLVNSYDIRNPAKRVVATKLAHEIGALALLFQQFPRVEAFKLINTDIDIIFVGEIEDALSFGRFFLDSEALQIRSIGKYTLWSLHNHVKRWLSNDTQLVVCGLSPAYSFNRFKVVYKIKTPYLVELIIPLHTCSGDHLIRQKSKSVRQLLNRIQREGITNFFSQEKADFDFFYHRMYLPYIKMRHKELVEIDSYERLWYWFRKGGLVMIQDKTGIIAGSLVVKQNQMVVGYSGGILDGKPELFKSGAFSMAVWFSIQWARDRGAKYFNLGSVYAYRSDGGYHYKRAFNPNVHPHNRHITNSWTYLMQDPSESLINKLNQFGLIVKHHQKHYGVFLTQNSGQVSETDRLDLLKKAKTDGTDGFALISPDQVLYLESEPVLFDL
jgi:hypothetical protein